AVRGQTVDRFLLGETDEVGNRELDRASRDEHLDHSVLFDLRASNRVGANHESLGNSVARLVLDHAHELEALESVESGLLVHVHDIGNRDEQRRRPSVSGARDLEDRKHGQYGQDAGAHEYADGAQLTPPPKAVLDVLVLIAHWYLAATADSHRHGRGRTEAERSRGLCGHDSSRAGTRCGRADGDGTGRGTDRRATDHSGEISEELLRRRVALAAILR